MSVETKQAPTDVTLTSMLQRITREVLDLFPDNFSNYPILGYRWDANTSTSLIYFSPKESEPFGKLMEFISANTLWVQENIIAKWTIEDKKTIPVGTCSAVQLMWLILLTGKCVINPVVGYLLARLRPEGLAHEGKKVVAIEVANVTCQPTIKGEQERLNVYATLPKEEVNPKDVDRCYQLEHQVLLIKTEDKREFVYDLTAAQYGSFDYDMRNIMAPVLFRERKKVSYIKKVDETIPIAVWYANVRAGHVNIARSRDFALQLVGQLEKKFKNDQSFKKYDSEWETYAKGHNMTGDDAIKWAALGYMWFKSVAP